MLKIENLMELIHIYEKGKVTQIKNIENKLLDKSELFRLYLSNLFPNVCFISSN